MLRWKSRNFAVAIGELEENGWILEEEDSFVDRGLFQKKKKGIKKCFFLYPLEELLISALISCVNLL